MNQLYIKPRERRLSNTFNWTALNLQMFAFRGAYVFNEAHETVADIVSAGATLVQGSEPITGKVVRPGGYARTDTVIFNDMPAGPAVTFLVLCEDVGADAAAKAILYIDTAQGLPFIPNGLDVPIQPDWLMMRGWFR